MIIVNALYLHVVVANAIMVVIATSSTAKALCSPYPSASTSPMLTFLACAPLFVIGLVKCRIK